MIEDPTTESGKLQVPHREDKLYTEDELYRTSAPSSAWRHGGESGAPRPLEVTTRLGETAREATEARLRPATL